MATRPCSIGVAAGLYLMIRGRDTWAGVCLGLAVLIRPATIVIGLGMAVTKAMTSRSWKPLMTIGLPSLVGGIAYLPFNRILFGSFSPMAAYEAVGGLIGLDGIGTIRQPSVGPRWPAPRCSRVVVVAPGLRTFWLRWIKGTVPSWLWLTPLVALVYVLVHSSMEIASGAMFYNYRYPLEAVALVAPVLLATVPTFEATNRRKLILAGAAGLRFPSRRRAVFVANCWISTSGEFGCSLFG